MEIKIEKQQIDGMGQFSTKPKFYKEIRGAIAGSMLSALKAYDVSRHMTHDEMLNLCITALLDWAVDYAGCRESRRDFQARVDATCSHMGLVEQPGPHE